jgi:hypothetical protein
VALGAGFICGRVSHANEPAEQNEHKQQLNEKMLEDIVYYKKLTRELAEENRELRHKLNGSE